MKKISKIFIIILISLGLILGLMTISKAENDITDNPIFTIDPEMENLKQIIQESEVDVQNQSVQKNVFIFTQDDVNINYDIEGDLFVCCAGTVTIDSLITGNAFICAPRVDVLAESSLGGSLFSASKDMNLMGYIEKNVYSVCNNFKSSNTSTIGLDVFLAAQNITFNGTIYGDANLSFENITISNEASIEGNLIYSSAKEAEIPENIVGGKVTFNKDEEDFVDISVNKTQPIKDWISSTLTYLVFVLVLFFTFEYLMPNFINEQNVLKLNVLKSMLYGFIGLIIVPIISIILLVLGITSSLGLLLIATYLTLLIISSSVVLILISNLLKNKYGDKIKANDTLKQSIFIAITVILYKSLKLIPVAGGLITFVTFITGLGICINYLIHKKSLTEETK